MLKTPYVAANLALTATVAKNRLLVPVKVRAIEKKNAQGYTTICTEVLTPWGVDYGTQDRWADDLFGVDGLQFYADAQRAELRREGAARDKAARAKKMKGRRR